MRAGAALGLAAALTVARVAPARAHDLDRYGAPGALVSLSVEVDGRLAPLYPARDGSGRYYLKAREGSRYEVRLGNRTGERLGVVLVVDGLNAISGERQSLVPGSTPGRMYVLDPWDEAMVRGWRTSLREVRRVTFVDERASYAARSGKANAKMGWIEVAVFRERRAYAVHPYVRRPPLPWSESTEGNAEDRRGRDEQARAQEQPSEPGGTAAPPASQRKAEREDEDVTASKDKLGDRRPSYPGTGWGPRAADPVMLVEFDPEPYPAERLTIRYEYARALRALGILPQTDWGRDRLRERERGEYGFAQPPRW